MLGLVEKLAPRGESDAPKMGMRVGRMRGWGIRGYNGCAGPEDGSRRCCEQGMGGGGGGDRRRVRVRNDNCT